jgi:hypothetical protein
MSSDEPYTYNPLSNEDKELLLRNGYRPGELRPDEERELLQDLRDGESDVDDDSERGSTIGDERDGSDADS